MRRLGAALVVSLCLCAPRLAAAQQDTSGIAGVVRDTSGAVLPGVTVEASSPALIERVRTAVTDAAGQYKIENLRPGTYAVTFSLTGFATVRREGIELIATFTAPVNAEMKIGSLEETILVTGSSPIVDVQNVVRGQVVGTERIDSLPTAKNWSTIALLTVGVISNQSDVGGSAGEHQNQVIAHGGSFTDKITQVDGLYLTNLACAYSCTGPSANDASTQEISTEIGAISAETASGGVRINIIGKDGGNQFSGSFFGNFANSSFQGNNLSDELKAIGVRQPDSLDHLFDTSAAVGGPLQRDRLWFWTAHRYWGYSVYRTDAFWEINPFDLRYEADVNQPATDSQWNTGNDLRLTWQMSPKNRLSAYYLSAPRETNHWVLSSLTQPDASQLQRIPLNWMGTLTYRSTVTNQLLFEAGFAPNVEMWTREPVRDSLTSRLLPVTDQLAGNVNFRAWNGVHSRNFTDVRSYRGSMSYVTGSHAFKVGFNLQEGRSVTDQRTDFDTAITVRNGAPFQVTVRTTPYTTRENLDGDFGVYAQDRWTIKRLTVNAGLRFDALINSIPAQDAPGGTWIGPRRYDAIENAVNWKDLGPRFGAVYDLFGNAKTAVRFTVSRYVAANPIAQARQINPINTSVNQATRSWTDVDVIPGTSTPSGLPLPTNGDGVPQANEMGPLSNANFGRTNPATIFDPGLNEGWFVRRGNWEFTTGVQHELLPRVSTDIAYFRRSQFNFTLTDNLEVTNADYDPFCVTAPNDPGLPGGGGYEICGLYDVKPNKFGLVRNLQMRDTTTGQSEVFHGVDFAFNVRASRAFFIQGGVATGNTFINNCGTFIDNPAEPTRDPQRQFCDANSGWLTDVKLSGAYTLPWDLQASAVLQNLRGPEIRAVWPVTSAQVSGSLGRNISGNQSINVNLIAPGTMFAARRNQLDIRLSKGFRLGATRRLRANLDLYNALNSDAPVGTTPLSGAPPSPLNQVYSPPGTAGRSWLRPVNLLQARYIKIGAQFTF